MRKNTAKQPCGRAKQEQSGKTTVAASLAEKQQAPQREPSSNSKRQSSRRLLDVHREVHKTLHLGLWDEHSASSALRSGYCSESRRWVYALGSFFLGAKYMRQPFPRIAARDTITRNHSVTDDVRVVGTTKCLGLGTL